MMDQNWCSPSAEYASTVSQADKDELLGIIEQNARVISRQESRIKIPEEALRLARHKRFAPGSEQSHAQEYLFDEAEAIDEAVESARRRKPAENPFPETFPEPRYLLT